MSKIEDRLNELGYPLPQLAAPAGSYLPAVKSGDLVFTSGQLPFHDGELANPGRLGDNVTVEQAQESARYSVLNALAAAKSVIGDLDKIERVVKVNGFVTSTDDFKQQPEVINGASDFLADIFGEAGQHARSALGTNALPKGTCVEIEFIFRVRD